MLRPTGPGAADVPCPRPIGNRPQWADLRAPTIHDDATERPRPDSRPAPVRHIDNVGVGSSGALHGPTKVDAARREAGAERGQHDPVARGEAPRVVPLRESDRDRRGDGIAVPLEVEDDTLEAHAQALGDRLDDATIGLVRDEPGDVLLLE